MDNQETQVMLQFFQRGGALRMLLGKDASSELDVLFRYAKQLADVGEYGAAARLFKVLTIYDGWSFDYWFELGMCCQAEKAWVDAIYAYGRAAQIRVSVAIVPCAAGECYLACGNRTLAAKAFRAALLVCGTERDGLEQAEIRQRARAGLVKAGDEYERFDTD
ncbi:CesD/SycD/LcrH family type III secretion system chaperone SscA [Yersinia mollaretii]|uniref:CesD/SycD/LcrH family type III secretion system chaperone SscA n=1 Tax=Yersinia mollaretii TaxID=33060 RepID=UPI0011A36360|nr:CesD/SycD/LcrH family type III secretion system chaperone SscA [Yersinia mollaretii]